MSQRAVNRKIYIRYMIISGVVLIGDICMTIALQSRSSLICACLLVLAMTAITVVHFRQAPG